MVNPTLFTEFDQFGGEVDTSEGVAWGDYDNDGDLDLAVTNLGQNKLYRNDGDNYFTEFDEFGSWSDGLAWGDYDNDGDLDLAIAHVGQNKLYVNNGDGSFTEVNPFGTGFVYGGVAWGDYNHDGLIDLAVANMDGGAVYDRLYKNNGDGSFTELPAFSPYATSGMAWGDYDADGDLDMATADWGGNSELYKNNGDGTFSEAFTFPTGGCFGAAWGDYDTDGDLDVVFSGYKPFGVLRVFKINGNGAFSEITLNYNRNKGLAWGDYDNDGGLDLAVTKHDTTQNKLYRNDGDDSFIGLDQFGSISTQGIAWGDYDNDGDLDLAVGKFGQNKLYRNVYRNGNDYLKVKLIGRRRGWSDNVGYTNRDGIGAVVNVYDQATQELLGYREISAGSGYSSMNALEAHFGVSEGNTYKVEIDWPTSGITMDTLVAAPAKITVWEYCRGDANGDRIVDGGDVVWLVSYCYRGGPAPDPLSSGDANADGTVNVGDIVYLVTYLYSNDPPPPPPSCPL